MLKIRAWKELAAGVNLHVKSRTDYPSVKTHTRYDQPQPYTKFSLLSTGLKVVPRPG